MGSVISFIKYKVTYTIYSTKEKLRFRCIGTYINNNLNFNFKKFKFF